MVSPSAPRVELPSELSDAKELAPYPGGDMPLDGPDVPAPRWCGRYWTVYQALHQGKTNKQAAELAGYTGEERVVQLRKAWRRRYGVLIRAKSWDETLLDPRYARPVTAEEIGEKVEHDHLVIGVNARTLTQAWLREFLGDTEEAKARRAKLTPAEVAKIQDIGLTAERASQGVLEAPGKGKAAAATPKPTTGAQKAVGALGAPRRTGPKGRQAEDAGAIVVGLRDSLRKFQQDQGAQDEQTG